MQLPLPTADMLVVDEHIYGETGAAADIVAIHAWYVARTLGDAYDTGLATAQRLAKVCALQKDLVACCLFCGLFQRPAPRAIPMVLAWQLLGMLAGAMASAVSARAVMVECWCQQLVLPLLCGRIIAS